MIHLIGLGPSKTIPQGECWGLAWDGECSRYSRVFEMHDWERHVKEKGSLFYLNKLRDLDIPVYMQEERPEVPYSVRYPIEHVIRVGGDRFWCSLSYMIGLAILENPDCISLHGFDMTDGHGHQAENVAYWLGVAQGRGIHVMWDRLDYKPIASEPAFKGRYGYY